MTGSRTPMSALLVGVIILACTADAALGQAMYHRYSFKERLALPLNAGRVAVFVEGDVSGAAATAALGGHGIPAISVEPHAVDGWTTFTAPLERQNAAGIEALVGELAAGGAFDFVSPVFAGIGGEPVIVTRDLLVRFEAGVPPALAEAILALHDAGTVLDADWGGMSNAYRLRARSRNGFEALAAANALAERREVRWAEPDWMFTVDKAIVIPNDPLFNNCWNVHNTGQNGGTEDIDLDGPEAWEIETGSPGIIVLVMDDGVDQDHPDLNQIPGMDFTGQGGGGDGVNVCDTHGTPVSGAITAFMNNNLGVVGTAPAARIASARVVISNINNPCDPTGSSQASWWVNALDWAQDSNFSVTNNSNGFTFADPSSVTDKYNDTYAAGIVHFASAGNNSSSVLTYPASLPVINAISAVDRFGNLDAASNFGNGIDFGGPGRNICSTTLGGGFTSTFGITSAASPAVAGVAALILSQDPSMTPGEVEELMRDTAKDLGPPGFDTSFGWGMPSAWRALREMVYGDICPGPQGCFDEHASPGCNQEECCFQVCTEDPLCCTLQWDAPCVVLANALCLSCPGVGACDQTHGTPGCDDANCCSLVCQEDPLCCDEDFGWSEVCVGLAVDLCGLAPDNDDCGNALPIGKGDTLFSISNASSDGASHFGDCGWDATFTKDVWYDYTADCEGYLAVSTCSQAAFQTWIGVYQDCGCPLGALDLLACETDSPGCANNTATVGGIFVNQGDCYKIRIGALAPQQGGGTVTVTCTALWDDCDGAFNLGSFEGSININNRNATTDGPPHAGCDFAGDDQVNSDVWFDWTSPCTGALTVSTCNSVNYDSKLAVYDGAGCPVGNNNLLGCNDDAAGCGLTSRVKATVFQGQDYKIRVGGYLGSQGSGQMSIDCTPAPANDECADAALTFLGVPTPFTTIAATTDGDPFPPCGQICKDVWFRRTATCTGLMRVSTCGTATFDTALAVYDGCTCPADFEDGLGCNDDGNQCPPDGTSEVIVPVVGGNCYLVRIGSPHPAVAGPLCPLTEEGTGTVEFECFHACPGDLNNDGFVDVIDLLQLLGAWGPCPLPCVPYCVPDINHDCAVDVVDLLEVLGHWGICNPT